MTDTKPPIDFQWTTNQTPTINEEIKERHRTYLDQFDLEISSNPENGYRYWRWLGEPLLTRNPYLGHLSKDGIQREVKHWERRPWNAKLPTEPGHWPQSD